MKKYDLYTTNNCGECERVKALVKRMNLDIKIQVADANDLTRFRKQKVMSFPILTKEGEVVEFGAKAGYYIAENLDKIPKKEKVNNLVR